MALIQVLGDGEGGWVGSWVGSRPDRARNPPGDLRTEAGETTVPCGFWPETALPGPGSGSGGPPVRAFGILRRMGATDPDKLLLVGESWALGAA